MRFRPGDVLYVSRNPQLRKAAIADFNGICANTTYVCRANEKYLLQDFLPFIMQTESFVEYTIRHKRGSTNFYLNWSDIAEYEFALPPLEEQRRIAEVLQAATNLSRRLQEATLAATAAKDVFLYDLFECGDSDAVVCGQIRAPGHWRPMHLPELAVGERNAITAGPFGTIFKAKDFRDAGIPIIQLRHLTDQGVILDKLTFMDEEVYQRLHKPYAVRPGDLVLTKMGEPPGLAAIYPADAPVGMVTPDVIKVTLDDSIVLPRFAVAMFNNAKSRANLLQLCKGGTRTRVSLDELYALTWPIPPLDEQQQLLRTLDGFNECGSRLDSRIQKVSQVSKAILADIGMGRPI